MAREPTDVLREEHRVILRGLDALETAARRLETGGSLPEGWWEELLAWLRAFADRNHHAKEEQWLFPAMVKAGVPSEGGPIGVMLDEHVEGRALIQAMQSGEPAQRPAAARKYLHLLRQHIEKENGVLLPLAEAVLEAEAQHRMAREFAAVEAEQGPLATIPGGEEALARLIARLG
jgi:hemerythrin-like domain-containing protein